MIRFAGKPTFILLIVTQSYFAAPRAEEIVDPNAAIQARLENIEQLLANQGLLEMLQQLEALQGEINRLRGEIEVQNHMLEQMKKRQRDLYTDVDRRMQQLESPLSLMDPTATSGPAGAGTSPPLQTLSPIFDPVETSEGLQADTPLTLELVGQGPAAGAPETPAMSSAAASTPLMTDTGQDITSALTTPGQDTAPALTPPGQDASLELTPSGQDTTPVLTTPGAGATPAMTPPGREDITMVVPGAAEDDITGASTQADPDQARADYQLAFRLLKQSRYDQSVRAFREFLALHPDSEYADSAQFWLGETYYVNSLFDQALLEYTNLVRNYPDSRKLAQAKLKAGFCRHELGQIDQARKQLQELIQQHPGTTSARLAEDRLKQLAAITLPTDITPAN